MGDNYTKSLMKMRCCGTTSQSSGSGSQGTPGPTGPTGPTGATGSAPISSQTGRVNGAFLFTDLTTTNLYYNSSTPSAVMNWDGVNVNTSSDMVVNGITVGLGGGSLQSNVSVGYNALMDNTTGANNVAIGFETLPANTTGGSNIAVGSMALQVNTATGNVAVGSYAYSAGTSGSYNVVVGNAAMQSSSGNYNISNGNINGNIR